MARVVNAVGLTPMALYRHFKDRDELMDEVVGRILMERNAAIPRDGPWQDQLRALGARRARPPRALRPGGAGRARRRLFELGARRRHARAILEQAGYADDELAEMQVWIALSVGGYVMAESARRKDPTRPRCTPHWRRLEPEDADRLAGLIPRIDRAFDQMHERFADRLIQTVEAAAPS